MRFETDKNKNSMIECRNIDSLFIYIIIFILIANLCFLRYFDDYFIVFTSTVEILCAALSAALSIICIIDKNYKENQIYRHIGYGFFFMSIIVFTYIIIFNKLVGDINIIIRYALAVATFNLEYIIILVAFKLNTIKVTKKQSILIYGIISIFIIIFNLVVVLNLFGTRYLRIYSLFNFINLLFLSILLLIRIFINIEDIYEKKLLTSYVIFILLYQICFYATYFLNLSYKFESAIFKLISYYLLYEIMLNCILYKTYNNMQRNLIISQKKQKDLNSKLIVRNKMLKDFDLLIEKSENRYSNIIEVIKDGIILIYMNQLSFMNKEAEKFLDKFTEKDYFKKDFYDVIDLLLFRYKKYNKKLYENLKDIVESEKKVISVEMKGEGDIIYELYFIRTDTLNRVIYIKDMTQVKRYHKLRKEYTKYLNEEKLKNQFYSNISHELRTPINLIYSALQLNEVSLDKFNYDLIERNNNAIKQNCFRLIRTINNFIDSNKVTEGYLYCEFKVYNIVSIVENISLACKKYFDMIENTFIFDSNEEEAYLYCDKDMIERIMLNLLSNSVKYGRKGGIILVEVEVSDENIIIYVRNNGYSISKELQPYLFDKFTKLNKSFDREKEGSGLGLYLTKKLVELQSGEIKVFSDKEKGTEFRMIFNRESLEEYSEEDEIYDENLFRDKVDIEFSDIYL